MSEHAHRRLRCYELEHVVPWTDLFDLSD